MRYLWHPPLSGAFVGISHRVSCGKTRMMRLPGDEKNWWEVSLFRYNTSTWQTDGRTDRHRTSAKTALCIASRSKNHTSILRRDLVGSYKIYDIRAEIVAFSFRFFVDSHCSFSADLSYLCPRLYDGCSHVDWTPVNQRECWTCAQ